MNEFHRFNDKLDQLKVRFRNVSEIIDCVSCQKCYASYNSCDLLT